MSILKKTWLKNLLKIAFVLGLLFYLSQKGFISMHETRRAISDWRNSSIGFAVMMISGLLGALRWQLLLRAQGTQLPLLRTTQLTLIGNFFNIALPGAVSGDFVKAFYIGKELSGQRARTFGSILFDRVAGLSALVLIAASALTLGYEKFEHSALMAGTRVFIVIGAACVLFLYLYLFVVREHHDPVLKLLRALEARVPKTASLTEMYVGLRHYHHHRVVVLQVLGISVIIQLLVGWACAHFVAALGEPNLSMLAIYVIVPLGMLVTAVPVAPAGLGTGHAAFLFLFGLLGCKRGADIFTLFALGNIMFGMIGGMVYLRFRSNAPAPALDPVEA